ncbi:quinone oxidoreductase family protein [Sphingobium tyrosinilyticum]|uniref:Zinc-binding alcohol dehydrogenase family protein n=1 Tax=Sphingobium tyrosinilyticum TaxID=2715436 RepID=A0ABV9F4P5_9SPHN
MKAAIYDSNGGPRVLRYVDVPDPVAGPGDVLIHVEAISIEGGDLMGRRSVTPGDPPRVKGYVAAGRVMAVGEEVADFQIGDRVTSFAAEGSHAELRAVPATQCWRVPTDMDLPTAAAALVPFGTAGLALKLGGLRGGDVVLVQGASGGVGVAAVQIAHKAGARVLGTGSEAASLEALRVYGLTDPIVTDTITTNEYVRSLLGQGVDLVIDNVGGRAVTIGLKALADGGRLVLVGLFDHDVQPIDPITLLVRRLTVVGCYLGPIIAEPWVRAMIDNMLLRIAAGDLSAPIDRIFPLNQAAAAHERAEARGRIGRVVMVP